MYSGLQGAAAHWKLNGWVSSSGPVSNIDLLNELLGLVSEPTVKFQWLKIPSHAGLEGNDAADHLAYRGGLSSPLYQSTYPVLRPRLWAGLFTHLRLHDVSTASRRPAPVLDDSGPAHPSQRLHLVTPLVYPARILFPAARSGIPHNEDFSTRWFECGPMALDLMILTRKSFLQTTSQCPAQHAVSPAHDRIPTLLSFATVPKQVWNGVTSLPDSLWTARSFTYGSALQAHAL